MYCTKVILWGQSSLVEPGYWHKGLAKALCGVPRRDESVAERAPHLCSLAIEGMGGVLQDSVELPPRPLLCNRLQIVQYNNKFSPDINKGARPSLPGA